jgi:hypothetical protein
VHVLKVQAVDSSGIWGKSEINVVVSNPAWMIPSAARASGAGGTFWTTDMTVANTGLESASFSMKFLGHDVDGRTGPEKTFVLEAGRTVTFSDVLYTVYGVDSGYGAIQVTSGYTTMTVQSQTSTPWGSGTFGQSVPSLALTDLITAGTTHVINAIREDAFFRTNLVLVNTIDFPLDVDVWLKSSAGDTLASKRYTLPPKGMTQISQIARNLGVAADLIGGALLLSTSTPNGSFAAYASVIDNVTNDPRTLLSKAGYTWLLPSIARVSGSQGAFWVTDLSVTNGGTGDSGFTLKFLNHDTFGGSGPTMSFGIKAGETKTFTDVLYSVFGINSGYGALQLTTSSSSIVMSSQTYTSGAGGTFGQSVPGFSGKDMIVNKAPRSITGIREDPSFRTNLILANGTLANLEVLVTLVSAEGETLANRNYSLLPMGMTQVSSVVRALGVTTDVVGARLILETPIGNGFFAAYASTIDNITNDPRTLLPQ